jgi:hypothetical protein
MRAWIVIALVGCNHRQAAAPDAAHDAVASPDGPNGPPVPGARTPWQCPAIGTLPQFAATKQQAIAGCTEYMESASAGIAMVTCSAVQFVGPFGGTFAKAIGLPIAGFEQLFPEGNQAFGRTYINPPTPPIYRWDVYTQDAFGTWGQSSSTPFMAADGTGPTKNYEFGVPSRANPERQAFVHEGGTGGLPTILHLVASPAWSEVQQYSMTDLGLATTTGAPQLSSDGLRFVVSAVSASNQVGIFYADRATTADRFSPARLLFIAATAHPYLTDDCGRMYFDGSATTVVYVDHAP